ncbi:MAG TPA: glycosyltransferase [Bacteroidales bacterium]|nr:glycosyltransferase [Bacteroidales bacterium]
MSRVSVILGTYNSAAFIERTVQSVISQEGNGSDFEIELLTIDDCSTDNTVEILRSMGLEPLSTQSPSGGPNRGRNTGLKRATGDYIALIDHDDTWHPAKIRTQLSVADQAPIITTGYRVIDNARKTTSSIGTGEPEVRFFEKNVTFLDRLARRNSGQPVYMSTIMFRRELSSILFEEEYGCVDYDWLLRLFEGRSSVHCSKALATRYISGENLSLQSGYRGKEYNLSARTAESYRVKYPDEAAQAFYRINGTRARYHYVAGDMALARKYLRRSAPGLKTLLYYLTSFAGSSIVKRFFRVFG